MGSFANSLHVKCEDAARVAAAIREVLAGGWKETEAAVAREACTAADAKVREVHVSAAVGGWVSVLDSDLSHLEELTRELAAHLGTPALLCFVDDSDSWSYQLAGPSGPAGQFDSAELPEVDEASAAAAQPSTPMQRMQALMKEDAVQDRMQEIQAQMSAGAPPEIRAAEDRIRNRQGTPADMQQVQAYALTQLPKYMAELRTLLGGAMTPPAAPPPPRKQRTPKEQAAQQQRLDDLRPVLAAGVTDEQVQAVLTRRATFAEEVLAAFLPLVGIERYYANLSYDYLEDSPPADLATHNIRFVHSLRFQRTTAKSKAKKKKESGNK